MTDFDGETYDRPRDQRRLTGQLHAVRNLMLDAKWRGLAEIAARTGAPQASVSARLRDLRKGKFGGYRIERRYAGEGLWEYRLTVSPLRASLPPYTSQSSTGDLTPRWIAFEEPPIPEGSVAAMRPGSHVIEEGEEVSVTWPGVTGRGPIHAVGTTVWWAAGDVIPAEWVKEQ